MVDYRKLSYRLVTVIALCLMAVPALAVDTVAQYGPSIGRSPVSGVPGDAVTVTGSNFTAGENVDIYFGTIWIAEATVTTDRSFLAVINVPNTYRGIHKIRAEESFTIYAETRFTVQSGLTVSPEEGQVGDTVTVEGRGYGQNETGIQLYFGGQRVLEDKNIQADQDGWWQESFVIPPAISGTHSIDTVPNAFEHATFTVVPGIRTDRSSGSPGESIVMTGGGFTANERNIGILLDGGAVVTGIWSDDKGYWEEPFEVPEMPAGEYTLTAEGDRTLKEEVGTIDFEVKPGIELSPDEGHVGMNVTATGRGFAAGSNVTVMYEDIDVTRDTDITTDENGSFEITFAVPESRHGDREVTAEDGEDNETEVPAIFTVEDDPPDTPEQISPIEGQRVGFARRVRPTFQWKEVFDLSGVSYTLKISTSANFTDPMVIENLSGNYTLEKDRALPHGTYYWTVKAVDGAQNESGWSDPESFRAGRLPLWAFIVIMVFVALGAAGAFYYYRVRRTLYD